MIKVLSYSPTMAATEAANHVQAGIYGFARAVRTSKDSLNSYVRAHAVPMDSSR